MLPNKLRKIRFLLWAVLLGMLLLIFGFSSQTGDESGDMSGKVTEILLRVIRPDFEKLPQKEQAEMLKQTNHYVRKCAHFAEYALLALVFYLLLRTYPLKLRALLSWLGASAYAVTDEIHQLYVGERMGSAKDVLIDSFGAAAGVTLGSLIAKRWKKKHG